jgi:hypothetical protein
MVASMSKNTLINICIGVMVVIGMTGCKNISNTSGKGSIQDSFDISTCNLGATGRNQYFILEPGFQLVLEDTNEKLIITVLDETVEVMGIVTRVVEEREWKNDELKEVSRNFFAICEQTQDVYYFGEDVEMYADGVVTSHEGQWLAGVGDSRPGLIMAGQPVVGYRYFQEVAPGIAMDHAEVISLDENFNTPAGDFSGCLKTKEGTTLNPVETEFKHYAPGIGLIQDETLLLTNYGFFDHR